MEKEELNIIEIIRKKVKMHGAKIDDEDIFQFEILKSRKEVLNFCNIEDIPEDVQIYFVEWAVANYLTVKLGYSKEFEKMRENAEIGLIKYRKLRW